VNFFEWVGPPWAMIIVGWHRMSTSGVIKDGNTDSLSSILHREPEFLLAAGASGLQFACVCVCVCVCACVCVCFAAKRKTWRTCNAVDILQRSRSLLSISSSHRPTDFYFWRKFRRLVKRPGSAVQCWNSITSTCTHRDDDRVTWQWRNFVPYQLISAATL